jgi:hypothetical protein
MLGFAALAETALAEIPATPGSTSSPLPAALIQSQNYPLDQQPPSRLWSGVQGPNVAAPPQIGVLFQGQFYPLDHPASRFASGVQGPNVAAPPQIGLIIQGQLYPLDHPTSKLWSGVQGPNVRPPIRDVVLTAQQLPSDHPASRFWTGVQGPTTFVFPAPLIGRREEILTTASALFAGVPPHVAVQAAAIIEALITRQEIPAERIASLLWSGIAPSGGPSPPANVTDYILRARRRHRR